MPLMFYIPRFMAATNWFAIEIDTALAIAALAAFLLGWHLRRRGMEQWLTSYILSARKRRQARPKGPVHVLICIADHYEPRVGKATEEQARQRVQNWVTQYPALLGKFRDSDGKPPQHTFFFPLDEYDPQHVDALAGLCAAGYGEIEIHLHHDHDTDAGLRKTLLSYKQLFREKHGLLATDRRTGEIKYGFIHGNWALDNSRPDGRWCGVNNELDVLRETGCYADFTLPSAPSPTQTRKINSIYYAIDDPLRPKSHDWGTDLGAGNPPANALLLIQGPLLLDWGHRKAGLFPHVENGCLQRSQPPSMHRLNLWMKAHVQAPLRPDWFFVKLHAHGATEVSQQVLLGNPMVEFHEALARRAAADREFHYHYVTAREMYNLAKAAEAGWQGSVADARDFELLPAAPVQKTPNA